MTEKVESVEALAERIVAYCLGVRRARLEKPFRLFAAGAIEEWLRDHGIEQPTEKQRPADDANYETAWLIETKVGGTPVWYAGLGKSGSCLGKHGWTTDAYKAQRFKTKALAENCIAKQGSQFPNAIATEHGFDSTTVAEIEDEPETDFAQLQQAMDEYGSGKSRDVQEVIDEFEAAGAEVHVFNSETHTPPQPAEPVVTDEDKLIAKKILHLLRDHGTVTDAGMRYWLNEDSAVFAIIAKARQAERDELRRLREQRHFLAAQYNEATAKCGSLQTKLTAAEARVRELEQQLQLHAIDAGRVAHVAAEAERKAKNVLHNYRIDADGERGEAESS